MSSVIQNILDNVIGDGARSTKFECLINFISPSLIENNDEVVSMVKTSQFPGKTHETIPLKFKGRTIPIKGQTKYDNTWSCTFYLTQDHKLKKAFDDWIESIDQKHNIKEVNSVIKDAQMNNNTNIGFGYTTDLQILQMDFHGEQETAVYTLHNAFPKSVSVIDVDYSAVGQILEFTVEFSYSHFDIGVDKAENGSFVDEIKDKAQSIIDNSVNTIQDNFTNLFR